MGVLIRWDSQGFWSPDTLLLKTLNIGHTAWMRVVALGIIYIMIQSHANKREIKTTRQSMYIIDNLLYKKSESTRVHTNGLKCNLEVRSSEEGISFGKWTTKETPPSLPMTPEMSIWIEHSFLVLIKPKPCDSCTRIIENHRPDCQISVWYRDTCYSYGV